MEQISLTDESIDRLAKATAKALFAEAEDIIENQRGFLGLWTRYEFEQVADRLGEIVKTVMEKKEA